MSKTESGETGNNPTSSLDKLNTTASDPSGQLLDCIAQQALFKGLSAQHLQLLRASAMFSEFKAGEQILHQDQPANRFYLVLDGKVELEAEGAEQGMIHIRTLGPGGDLGWSWLFPPYYLHFSARAIEPTKTIAFFGTRLRQQCEADHEFGYELMKRLAAVMVQSLDAVHQQLVKCDNTIAHLGGKPVTVRDD